MEKRLTADLNVVANSNLEIQLLDGDLNIIQKLDDEPNDVGGLTSAELKAKFDEGGNIIKKYINETLIPSVLTDDATEESRKQAEAARVAAEQGRVTAEEGRVSAESGRVSAEQARDSAETARSGAESTRQSQEAARQTAETKRNSAETARAQSEQGRSTAETARTNAETARREAETSRATAESNRAVAEQGRVSGESTRVQNETQRVSAEQARSKAESSRVSAENAREAAERARADETAGIVAQATAQANAAAESAESASASAQTAQSASSNAGTAASTASSAATSASGSASQAQASAAAAAQSAASVDGINKTAQSWAVGGTGTRPGEDTDNAKYWAEQAQAVAGGDFATKNEAQGYVTAHNQSADAHSDIREALDGKASKPKACLVTLKSSGWDATAKTQVATVACVVADEAAQMIHPMPKIGQITAYNDAGIQLIAQGDGNVTFMCDTIPTENVDVWVVTEDVEDVTPHPCLTFSSPNSFTINVTTPGWDGTMKYSTDKSTWTAWNGAEIAAVNNGGTYVLYLSGTGNTKVAGDSANKWTLTGSDIACNGNIEVLLDYATVAAGNHPTMATRCYSYMFVNCTGLTAAPALPATTLADNCYNSMFGDCTKLKLSATQTGSYTKAYRIPTSGTGVVATGALTNMFANTGGTFTGTPEINTTYYLDASNTIV